MRILQETAPVLFELISLKCYVHEAMSPILKEIIKKANVPFQNKVVPSTPSSLPDDNELQSLCFFPSLSRVHL